ncbi:MAG: CTP synthetase [Alphaproteobacteria bacterium]|nr:CTP synthetase [Alphaproteobacteria bacterium]
MKTPYVFAAVQGITASVIGWAGIVAALVMGHGTWQIILACVAVSFIVAFPIASVITKRMTGNS